ncbi:putative transmembrane protein [Gregarina niphandrodes]|uniref:Transmembrane protein n=1 Tax=Gregarina niphandrodes TaxID=110365 RepID=A0A023B3V0_GRENI|nr:putative transmembrane protein [Gregarina niphandrodes]EZG55978.1 putative transmembrane protein [Gregarina niphandrodes]|eukprot:XP_011131392.1 putative transmembrane protein [Gregarina niphandrodes]
MKTLRCTHLRGCEGSAVLAAFVGGDGGMSPLDGCIARMAVVSAGGEKGQVLALAPPSEFLQSDWTQFDWTSRWNRVRPYHPSGASEASRAVKNALAHTLNEALEGVDESVVDALFVDAFDARRGDRRNLDLGHAPLEILNVRALTDDEYEQLREEVNDEWKPVLDYTRAPPDADPERQQLYEDRGPTRRTGCTRTRLFIGLGIGAGVTIAGIVAAKSFSESSQDVGSSQMSVPGLNSSEALPELPAALVGPKAREYPIDIAELDLTELGGMEVDGKEGWYVQDYPIPLPRQSELQLELLRVPESVCSKTHVVLNLETNKRETPWGWSELGGWGECAETGGKVVCYNTREDARRCYYFGSPGLFDLPTVWKDIVFYEWPNKCEIECNSPEEHELLLRDRIGKEWGRFLRGVDTSTPEAVSQLGRRVKDTFEVEPRCSWQTNYHCHDQKSPPSCRCGMATLRSEVVMTSGERFDSGEIVAFNTFAEELIPEIRPSAVKKWDIVGCNFTCQHVNFSKLRKIGNMDWSKFPKPRIAN